MAPLHTIHTIFALSLVPAVTGASRLLYNRQYCSVVATDPTDCYPPPDSFLHTPTNTVASDGAGIDILQDAFSALAVLQNEYYKWERNTWPSAIDWTAAVTETVVSGMLSTLTTSLDLLVSGVAPSVREAHENVISAVYDQVIGFHFGQDIVAIRDQVCSLLIFHQYS